jgi:hypothetical protein
MGRLSKHDRQYRRQALAGIAIWLATLCYVIADAVAHEHIAPYGRSESVRVVFFWGLPVTVTFALGYWIISGTAGERSSTETRLITVVAGIGVVSGHLVAYGLGTPAGIVPTAPLSTAAVRTGATTVFVALGAIFGAQLASIENGNTTLGWRLAAVAGGAMLLAGVVALAKNYQPNIGVFFLAHGCYWLVIARFAIRQ